MLRNIKSKFTHFKSNGKINVIVDEVADKLGENSSDSVLLAFHDNDDRCMKVMLSTYTVTHDEESKDMRVIFKLADSKDINLVLEAKTEITQDKIDNDFVLAKCTAQSLLRKLHAKKLFVSDCMSFTATRGNSRTATVCIYTAKLMMKAIPLNKCVNVQSDTLSVVHAYLDKRELHFTFDRPSATLKNYILDEFARVAKAEQAEDLTDEHHNTHFANSLVHK